MVSMLDRKLLRDLGRMKGQVVAIVLLVACGVTTFVGSMATWRSLLRSQQEYYDRCRFGDVFVQLHRAPEFLAAQIAMIPGVAEVETRVVDDATVELEGFDEPVTARLVSLPPSGTANLNRSYLRAGRTVDGNAEGEIIISEPFAKAHHLRTGDSLTTVIRGHKRVWWVVGIGLSPEYVYEIRPGDLMPDEKHFGVFWVSRERLAAASDMKGAFNDVSIRLGPGASEPHVLSALDELLEPHGGLGAYGRSEQISNRLISDEIRQLKANAVVVPGIFLGVAAFVLNVVMSRLVGTQREQIATLKALGYTNIAAGTHYAKLVTIVVLVGTALGTLGGAWMCRLMTGVYAEYYRFPSYIVELQWAEAAIAGVLSLFSAALGVGRTLFRVVRLPPAAAMRPEPPASYHPSLLERIGLGHMTSAPARMILRNLGRRPTRFLLSSLGIGCAIAILVVGWFFSDAMDYLIDHQFNKVQRDDASITFTTPIAESGLIDLASVAGVMHAEPFRSVPVRLRAGHRSWRTALLGMPREGILRRIIDRDRGPVQVPPDGVLLTDKLADLLHVGPGDIVVVDVLEGRKLSLRIPVTGTVKELVGVTAYMNLLSLHRLLDEAPVASGAFVALDSGQTRVAYRSLMSMPRVAGVTLRSAALHSFETISAESMLFFASILLVFAWIIACGIVYNSARVSLAERERELATLRVIGLTTFEVWLVLAGETALQLLCAIPLGCGLGYGLAWLSSLSVESDLYRIPTCVYPSTYVWAVGVVVVAATVVGLSMLGRIRRLNLVAVLKAKE